MRVEQSIIVNGQRIALDGKGHCDCSIGMQCPRQKTGLQTRCTVEELEACNDLILTAIHDFFKERENPRFTVDWENPLSDSPTVRLNKFENYEHVVLRITRRANTIEIVNDDAVTGNFYQISRGAFEQVDIQDPESFNKLWAAALRL